LGQMCGAGPDKQQRPAPRRGAAAKPGAPPQVHPRVEPFDIGQDDPRAALVGQRGLRATQKLRQLTVVGVYRRCAPWPAPPCLHQPARPPCQLPGQLRRWRPGPCCKALSRPGLCREALWCPVHAPAC
jgi:hypothetical protein